MATLIGIKYIAARPGPKRDCRTGSGLVWNDNEEVHYVTEEHAAKLLKHPDVWAEAGRKNVKGEVAKPVDAKKKESVEPDLPPLVPLDTMNKADLITYAKSHFGETLQPQMKEENMRTRIRNWMNSPMATGG